MRARFKLFQQFQIANNALFRAADQRTRCRFDITTTQLAVLFVLSKQDGLAISEIAGVLAMGKSSLTSLVDRMCEKGLVRRETSAEDGRVVQVFLQPCGRDMLDQGLQEVRRFNQALLTPFTQEEQSVIERFLNHLSENANDIINGDLAVSDGGKHD